MVQLQDGGLAGNCEVQLVLNDAEELQRFLCPGKDELFCFVLHPFDPTAKKAMAAAGRQRPWDVVDLIPIHERILLLGAAVWAVVEKAGLPFLKDGRVMLPSPDRLGDSGLAGG